MMKFVVFSLLWTLVASAAQTRNLVSCVKAYSDRETVQKKAACDASAQALDASSDSAVTFRSACVSGRDAFYKHGCGIYDVAWTVELTTTLAAGEHDLTRCFKAYSDRETRQALSRCETTSAALGTVASPQISFTVTCVSGRDAFYKYGCGIYDVALTGRLRLTE